MEWNGNGNGNGTDYHAYGIVPWKIFEFFVNSIRNHSIQFHSIPWNSIFHTKMPTSGCGWRLRPKIKMGDVPKFYIKFTPMKKCNFCVSLWYLVLTIFGVSVVFLVSASARFLLTSKIRPITE